MENISFNPENFLSDVDPETNLPNGSLKTYGTWKCKTLLQVKILRLNFIII